MTRIEAILTGIREELERRPQALEGGGLNSLLLHCHFTGDTWKPRAIIMRTEFHSPKPPGKSDNRSKGGI